MDPNLSSSQLFLSMFQFFTTTIGALGSVEELQDLVVGVN